MAGGRSLAEVARSAMSGITCFRRSRFNQCRLAPSNQIPWILRTQYIDVKATGETGADLLGHEVYIAKCAQCHGAARRGSFEWEGTGDAFIPALSGVTILRERRSLESAAEFRARHETVTVDPSVTAAELKKLYAYFAALDRRSDTERSFSLNSFW